MPSKSRFIPASILITTLAIVPVATSARADEGTDADPIEFIEDVHDIVSASENVATDTDEISAMITYEEGTYVDVPHALIEGVIFATDDGDTMFIDVPGAKYATDAITVANGLTVFEGTDTDANTAVQAMGEDGVRFFTEITGPDAPTEYAFEITVPEGGYMEYTPEGGIVVLDANEDPVTIIDPPWSKDALGNPIDVYYTIEGDSIIMTVDHYSAMEYPVVADPWLTRPVQKLVGWGLKKVTKKEVNTSIKDYYESRGYYCPQYLPWFFCAASAY